MRTFLELLPFRLEQLIPGLALRPWRTQQARRRSTPASLPTPAPNEGARRLFVDLSVISEHDAGTGIQRVVRELALALHQEAPTQWDIEFVSAGRKSGYRRIAWPDRTAAIAGEALHARPGDVFLGLDYSLDPVRRHRRQLARFRREGAALWFLMHDLLPLDRPEWFSRNTVIRYRAWLGILAGIADGFLCNSAHTEAELNAALARVHGLRDGFRTQVLPMGHTIQHAEARAGDAPPRFDYAAPFALMVGTLEPRKGHTDVIAAFDKLWQHGSTERLVLVGRLGWQVETLRDRIRAHPEHGSRLLWFDDVADPELSRIYEACTGVIVASHGEGFGLPLVEALGHGKPVLARDLPVFRVHEGKGVQYFAVAAQPADLAQMIEPWLDAARRGTIAVTRPTDEWRKAARTLLAAIDGTIWCRLSATAKGSTT